ncbi:MAG: hypothetical protein HDR09_13225 [Lachnospiraceae bacterium]|nr:hypothetical protein [Lachnospiraceae bacterium]
MKEKSGTGHNWIIFSVFAVVIPVVVAIVISCVINSKPPEFDDFLDSVILTVFSVACSLLSICYQVYQQKKDGFVKFSFYVSGFFMFLAWTCYVVSLTKTISNYAKIVSIVSCIVIIILSGFGIKLGKKSDENENSIIYSMHDNCDMIREKLLPQEMNTELKPHVIHCSDLLCNPEEFERVKVVMENILSNNGEGNDNG